MQKSVLMVVSKSWVSQSLINDSVTLAEKKRKEKRKKSFNTLHILRMCDFMLLYEASSLTVAEPGSLYAWTIADCRMRLK